LRLTLPQPGSTLCQPAAVPIPPLDADGLLPSGRHLATIQEVEQVFVRAFPGSRTRRTIFTSWVRHRSTLQAIVTFQVQWLDGSFVTSVENPADLDVVTWIVREDWDSLASSEQQAAATLLNGHLTKIVWHCDSWHGRLVQPQHPDYATTTAKEEAAWDWNFSLVTAKYPQFGHPRFRTARKGFLAIR
jgi:hypothetical protein